MAKFPTYEEMGKKVAEKALDEFLYDGKSIREWMQIIASEDAISRQAVLDVTWEEPSYTDALNVLTEVRDKVKALPPVNPQKPKTGHCKDCKHFRELPHHTETLGRCTLHDLRFYPKGDWYCADFEPREARIKNEAN